MKYSPEDMVAFFEWHVQDNEDWDDYLERAREDVEYKLRKWWSRAKFEFGKYSNYYELYVEETLWYHLERNIIYDNGLVCDLKRWRNAKTRCMNILKDIERAIREELKEKYFEKDDFDDPPVQRIPNEPAFEG
jgi:hypothetical protein